MKKIHLLLFFILPLINYSQVLKDSDIVGIWQVKNVETNFDLTDNVSIVDSEQIINAFTDSRLIFSEIGLCKFMLNPKFSEPFKNVYSKANYWIIINDNSIGIGRNKHDIKDDALQIHYTNSNYYFNLGGKILLKVKRINDFISDEDYFTEEDFNILNESSKIIIQEEASVKEYIINDSIIPFDLVEQIPITSDCEKIKKSKQLNCVKDSFSMFVARKFNTDLAADIGFSGKIKITTSFVINKEGNIMNITANSPYDEMTNEAIRVIGLIPKMTPAQHQGNTVSVRYELPIHFQIQD